MSRSDIISLVAVAMSLGSLAVSVYALLIDRARLRVQTQFFPASEYGPAHVAVTIANAGRRPIILRMWGGPTADGSWISQFFKGKDAGLRLGEHGRHEFNLELADIFMGPESELIQDFWVEDSLGRRHRSRNGKAHIQALASS